MHIFTAEAAKNLGKKNLPIDVIKNSKEVLKEIPLSNNRYDDLLVQNGIQNDVSEFLIFDQF